MEEIQKEEQRHTSDESIEDTNDCVILGSDPRAPILLDDEGTPLSGIVCLKTRQDMESIEKREACFILDFDPSESSIDFKRLSISGEEEDVVVIHEKGEVACRDYKHARHDCVKFPFGSTPHSDHCDKCCCRICKCLLLVPSGYLLRTAILYHRFSNL